jgi:hypothetical protein
MSVCECKPFVEVTGMCALWWTVSCIMIHGCNKND